MSHEVTHQEHIYDAVAEAETHALKYALSQILPPPEGHSNMLTAALVCGCRSCVSAYVAMVRWVFGEEKMVDAVVSSHLGKKWQKR